MLNSSDRSRSPKNAETAVLHERHKLCAIARGTRHQRRRVWRAGLACSGVLASIFAAESR
jgi:hypothetical protein